MQDIKDDILERTKQMISLCRNADSTAVETVINLAGQGDQLRNMNERLSSIDATLIGTKKDINRLKGVTQRVIGSFRTKFHRKIISKITVRSTKKQNSFSSSSSSPPPLRRRQSFTKIHQRTIHPSNSCVDGKIDEALDDIESLLHGLKGKAQDINDQLVGQATIIDNIHQHMDASTNSIQQQNTAIEKIHQ